MRSTLPALLAAFVIAASPAVAGSSSGLPTGKRQHKPLTISKNWAAYRPDARRLKDANQRRAALKLIDALETAKRQHMRGFDKSHRLLRGRKNRSAQHGQSDLGFLKERARRGAKGGGDVAMEELTLAHEGLRLIEGSYNHFRQTLGTRTDCVRACDAGKRQCEAGCRKRGACACVVDASDCLLSKIRTRRCSTAITRGWPAKVTGPQPKSDGR